MKEEYSVRVPRVVCGRRLILSPGLNPAGASPSIRCARGKQGGAERGHLSSVTCHPGARWDIPQDGTDLQTWELLGHIQTASACLVC